MQMEIPFTKAHGARNDFLLTWADEAPADRLAETATAICDRHTGVGADGWLLVSRLDAPPEGADLKIRLFNPDGGEVEMSGNGTRCAAAFAIANGYARPEIRIVTGGGTKHLRLLRRAGTAYDFEMNMGQPRVEPGHLRYALPVGGDVYDCTILWVGNPQCAVFVEDFDFDWRAVGASIERHPLFPNRTNVRDGPGRSRPGTACKRCTSPGSRGCCAGSRPARSCPRSPSRSTSARRGSAARCDAAQPASRLRRARSRRGCS